MHTSRQIISALYLRILRWYPAAIKTEFAQEMQVVFDEHLEKAAGKGRLFAWRLLAREALDVPGIRYRSMAWKENTHMAMTDGISIDVKEQPDQKQSLLPDTKIKGWQLFLGILPYLIGPIFTLATQLPLNWGSTFPINLTAYILMMILIVWMGLLVYSWVQSLPTWSLLYWAFFLVLTPYISLVSTPGLEVFGYPVFGSQMWAWRAWVPLLVVLLACFAVIRSVAPLGNLFKRLKADWTLVSFVFFAPIPLYLGISWDEVHGEEVFASAMQLILAGGVFFYLAASTARGRMTALLVSLVMAWVPSAIYIHNYWNGRYIEGVGTFTGNSNLVGMGIALLFLVGWILLPGFLTWLIRVFRRSSTGTPPPAQAG